LRPGDPMRARVAFALIAFAAATAGTGLWWATRPSSLAASAAPGVPAISPAAVWAASFADTQGRPHAIGELQGSIVVINFWATWCVPCREEMPGFARLASRWKTQGVRFVGLANDDPGKVERFARDLSIGYPLWLGGENVGELSRRLGNRLGVLPHTVILDPSGGVLETRVGPYTEKDLEAKLRSLVVKTP
jgi:thiol-disulfide isomerase/thioredoxin